uniref:Endonuclease/exonuclease/phosphatase domain-containing protein n=1 Tax=Hucho hucho TaxID=62062 RepID=A0A4W5LJP8_9TELE
MKWSWPGYDGLRHLADLDVPGRYLVVRTEWDGRPVYVHNVYAPVRPEERGAFYRQLPRDFEETSLHFVGGDFNLYLNSKLDSSNAVPDRNVGRGKVACVEWLTALRVVDVWRTQHPASRIFIRLSRQRQREWLVPLLSA